MAETVPALYLPFLRSKQVPTRKPKPDLPDLCVKLQQVQRKRVVTVKSRIMQENRLRAVIAGTLGYESSMEEKDRLKLFKEAQVLIEEVDAGKKDHPYALIILATREGTHKFLELEESLVAELEGYASQLPIASWVDLPQQRGFGLKGLATVVGECGNLADYPGVAKVWRRMGCAPWTYKGATQMGATWRSGKKVKFDKADAAAEWSAYGYSPRRRSIMWNIGECLVKQNFLPLPNGKAPRLGTAAPGPYRARYEEAKTKLAAEHAGDPAYPPGRCHDHGRLLASKRLLENLWIVWNKGLDSVKYPEPVWPAAPEVGGGMAAALG